VDGPARSWDGDGTRAPTGVMSHAVLQRVLPRDIHRWSFSAISDRARHAEFDPEDESLGDSGAADEPAEAHGAVAAVGTASRPELPLGAIAGGTQFGTLVHEVLALVDFAAADLDKEKEIFRAQAAATGKPAPVIEKIVEGKMAKFYEEVCLLEQPFIKDQAVSIKELIGQKVGKLGENITVRRFARFKVGAPEWTVAQTKPVEAATE